MAGGGSKLCVRVGGGVGGGGAVEVVVFNDRNGFENILSQIRALHKVLKKSAKKNLVSNCHTKNFTKSKIMTKVEKVPMFEGVVSCFKIVCTSQFFSRTQYTCQRLIVPICVTRVQSQHC